MTDLSVEIKALSQVVLRLEIRNRTFIISKINRKQTSIFGIEIFSMYLFDKDNQESEPNTNFSGGLIDGMQWSPKASNSILVQRDEE